MPWSCPIGSIRHHFPDLATLLAKAAVARAGAATTDERTAARTCLAGVPLRKFVENPLLPYEDDEVTRLILDTQDRAAFGEVAGWTAGQLRDWLLDQQTTGEDIRRLTPGLTPEMAVAVARLMGSQDLVLVASKIHVVTRFRNTQGLHGHLGASLHPDQPTDDPRGVAATVMDGLARGCGDAVIGVNPGTDHVPTVQWMLHLLDEVIARHGIPTQSCVEAHVTSQIRAIEHGAPVDLVFQLVAGSEEGNRSLGINLALLAEARQAGLSTGRCPAGGQVMYFKTGHDAHGPAAEDAGADAQLLGVRAFGVARAFAPFIVQAVPLPPVPGVAGDDQVRLRMGLEDIFCGKLLGLPMGFDLGCTRGPGAGEHKMDALLAMVGVAGCHSLVGSPPVGGTSTGDERLSFHDSHQLRQVLGLRPAPEFEDWLLEMGIFDEVNQPAPPGRQNGIFSMMPWLRQLAAAHAL